MSLDTSPLSSFTQSKVSSPSFPFTFGYSAPPFLTSLYIFSIYILYFPLLGLCIYIYTDKRQNPAIPLDFLFIGLSCRCFYFFTALIPGDTLIQYTSTFSWKTYIYTEGCYAEPRVLLSRSALHSCSRTGLTHSNECSLRDTNTSRSEIHVLSCVSNAQQAKQHWDPQRRE